MKNLSVLFSAVYLAVAALFLSPDTAFAQPKIQLVNFASGFDLPLDITHCGDSRLFVVERDGVIWVLDSLGNRLDTFLNIDPRVNSGQNEQGLLGLAFDPNYATNGYFYVDYTKNSTGNTRVARFSVKPNNPNEADPNSELTILEQFQPNWNHNGGCLKFGPDGYLYIGLGDGGGANDPSNYSQNKKNFLGKILRIDVKNSNASQPYQVPVDNPFVGNPDYLPEIWSLGWRNPWRFSFDRLTGDMWIADVGQNLWEEVDFEPANTPGLNYGWRCYEGTKPFNTSGCLPASNYVNPFFEYSHNAANGCSVTGGFIYRGNKYPDLYGCYLFADFCSGRWWYTRRNTNGTFTTNVLANLGAYEVSSLGEDRNGELYVAYLNSGKVQKIKELCSPFQISGIASSGICAGAMSGEITLVATGATGAMSYVWSNGATSQNISGLGSGVYTVEAKDGNSCFRRDTFEIVEVGPEKPTLSASDLGICSNGSVILIAGNLPVPSTLFWYEGVNIVATTNASDSTATLEVTQAGDYSVTVNDPLCPANSSIVSIVKIGPDNPSLNSSALAICPGGSATLTAGNLPIPSTLTWYNGSNIVATTNASDSTATLDVSQAGDYSVVINDVFCPASSSILSVSMPELYTPVLNASVSEICANGLVQLTASNLPVPSTLTWFNGTNIVATTAATDSTTTLDITLPGNYNVVVNHPLCLFSSSVVMITRIGPDTPVLSATASVICPNDSVQLTASNLPVPHTLTWYNGANIVATTNAFASTATLDITQSGDYSVIIDDPTCTVSSSIISVVLIGSDNPILSASDSVICVNGSVQLIAGNLPVPSMLSWYNGANIVATTLATASTDTFQITQPGDYSVAINDALCLMPSPVVSILRIGPDNPTLTAIDTVICVNGSVQLMASNLPLPSTLTWYNGSDIVATTNTSDSITTLEITIPGHYSVTINDPACLNSSQVVNILADTPIDPLIESNYDSLYALFPCSACQWLYYGQPVPGATGMYHIATQEGIYSLQVTSPNGCQYISDEVHFLMGSSKFPSTVRRFSLSPNPSEYTILLEMELEKNQHIKLSLTDTSQRQVYANAVEGQKIALPIDLSNLPIGTYFLKATMENGSFVRKLVKK